MASTRWPPHSSGRIGFSPWSAVFGMVLAAGVSAMATLAVLVWLLKPLHQ